MHTTLSHLGCNPFKQSKLDSVIKGRKEKKNCFPTTFVEIVLGAWASDLSTPGPECLFNHFAAKFHSFHSQIFYFTSSLMIAFGHEWVMQL